MTVLWGIIAAGGAGIGLGAEPPVAAVITHGYSLNGEKGLWVEQMAFAIVQRAGGGAVVRYRQDIGAWSLVGGTLAADQPLVLIYRWLDDLEKSGPNWGFAEGAADALYAAIRDPAFVDAAGAPLPAPGGFDTRVLHLIGHSRGACVNSEVAQRLGAAGVPVDQVTSLDPHPVNGTLDAPFDFDWGDPVPQTWSNVSWADNWWRADGGGFNALDFDGIPVPGTYGTMLSEQALECCAYGFSHSDVHLWYHGTLDTSQNPCDGEQCITDQMRQTWWPGGWTQTGFFFSALGGGASMRPPLAPGPPPGEVPGIYGGGFEQGSLAGWLYHGGDVDGLIVSSSGEHFLRLGAGAGAFARHNRMYLPLSAESIEVDYRIVVADALPLDEQVRVLLTDRDGAVWALDPAIPLGPSATGWIADHPIPIPASLPRGETYTLTLQILAQSPLEGVVDLDDVRLVHGPPADLDGDGFVGIAYLLALLAAWGPCPPTGSCDADLDRDGAVGIADLLLLLAAWS